MKPWNVEFSDEAERDLVSLSKTIRQQVLDKLVWFSINFDTLTPLALHADWKGFFKFRIGDIRVIYQIRHDKRLLLIEYIDRRDRVYKKRK